ncbi:MAG: hypothetical protein HGA72_08110 [Chlorobiaceae bacterium]|nr:hypothetical protein [Chlorobiaceae bacterium]
MSENGDEDADTHRRPVKYGLIVEAVVATALEPGLWFHTGLRFSEVLKSIQPLDS